MGEQVRGTPPRQVLPGDQHPERYRSAALVCLLSQRI